jgi:hypothetical protein
MADVARREDEPCGGAKKGINVGQIKT